MLEQFFSENKHFSIIVAVLISFVAYFFFKDYNDKEVFSAGGESLDQEEISKTPDQMIVEISGAIENPGLYTMTQESRVGELVLKSGGITNKSSSEWVARYLNLAEKLVDAQKIYIPFEWELSSDKVAATEILSNKSDDEDEEQIINVNIAHIEELKLLNGIGEAYANRIILNRAYKNLQELKEKSGVPEKVLNKISIYLTY